MENKKHIIIFTLRIFIALLLFVAVSHFSNFASYFIAQRMTTEVSEDVIRVIHIILSLLAYHSFFRAFIITDKASRKRYYVTQTNSFKYVFSCTEFRISLLINTFVFVLFPNAFAVKSLYGWLEISYAYVYLILVFSFFALHLLVWFECLADYKKSEEKAKKEKREPNDTKQLIKSVISASLAYPIMAYLLPIFFPTLRTLPKTIWLICLVLIPIVIAFILFFSLFDYIRAFFIRVRFINKLKKAAKKNGYILSKISHPYLSLFTDYNGNNFTIEANGKVYDCKLLSSLHYGDPIYFEEEGRGKVIRHISLRYRVPMAAPFAKGGMIWQKLPADLAQIHTDFTYGFESDGKKVLIICPTPHSVFVTGYGQNRPLDVNDKIWDYTIMTATAFINALERDAVK